MGSRWIPLELPQPVIRSKAQQPSRGKYLNGRNVKGEPGQQWHLIPRGKISYLPLQPGSLPANQRSVWGWHFHPTKCSLFRTALQKPCRVTSLLRQLSLSPWSLVYSQRWRWRKRAGARKWLWMCLGDAPHGAHPNAGSALSISCWIFRWRKWGIERMLSR